MRFRGARTWRARRESWEEQKENLSLLGEAFFQGLDFFGQSFFFFLVAFDGDSEGHAFIGAVWQEFQWELEFVFIVVEDDVRRLFGYAVDAADEFFFISMLLFNAV